jgi:hypothetical protein
LGKFLTARFGQEANYWVRWSEACVCDDSQCFWTLFSITVGGVEHDFLAQNHKTTPSTFLQSQREAGRWGPVGQPIFPSRRALKIANRLYAPSMK